MALSMAEIPSVFSLLSNALSGDANVRKPAEAALSEFESRSGFCSFLLEIITSESLAGHTEVRLLATVYFKNSINRYWRHRRDSYGISSEEKAHLRKKLLTDFRETNYQVDNIPFIQRKICALALAVSLKFRETKILEKLEQIVSVCTSVIMDNDEAKVESSSAEIDSIGAQNDLGSSGIRSTIETRKRQIKESDPIKQLALDNILKENLHACAAIHGESNFNSAMGRIHPSVLSQLQQALKMA